MFKLWRTKLTDKPFNKKSKKELKEIAVKMKGIRSANALFELLKRKSKCQKKA